MFQFGHLRTFPVVVKLLKDVFFQRNSPHFLSQMAFTYTTEVFLNEETYLPPNSVQQYCYVTVLPCKMRKRERQNTTDRAEGGSKIGSCQHNIFLISKIAQYHYHK